MFHEAFPDDPLYVLVDYFGREITDSLEVCRPFPELATEGRLGIRLDTHGGRFVEGLDVAASYAVLETQRARDPHLPQRGGAALADGHRRYRGRRSITSARSWTRPASIASRSSRARASTPTNAS